MSISFGRIVHLNTLINKTEGTTLRRIKGVELNSFEKQEELAIATALEQKGKPFTNGFVRNHSTPLEQKPVPLNEPLYRFIWTPLGIVYVDGNSLGKVTNLAKEKDTTVPVICGELIDAPETETATLYYERPHYPIGNLSLQVTP